MAAKLDPAKWATAEQYAQHIGMNVWTVRKLVNAGVIPAYKFGKGRCYIHIQKADAAMDVYMFEPKKAEPPKKKALPDPGIEANKAVKQAGGLKEALKELVRKREEAV